MQNRIRNSYKSEGDKELSGTVHRITNKMEGNSNFPNPPAALAEAKKLLPEFQVAVTDASGRDREKVSVKNDKKSLLVKLLTELDDYVTATCKGDRSMLLSSGFELARGRGEKALSSISNLDVNISTPGEATTRIKRVAGARVYIHQYTTDPLTSDSKWTDVIDTDTSHTFSGLPSAVKTWFRVTAIGLKGQAVYSPAVWRIIQ